MRKSIYFTGGNFHDLQALFDLRKDIMDTRAGYLNGMKAFPKFEDVMKGETGHLMAVKVDYDPEIVDIRSLVETYILGLRGISLPEGAIFAKGIYYDDFLDGVDALSEMVEHELGAHDINIAKVCNFFIAESDHQHYYLTHYQEHPNINIDAIPENLSKLHS